VTLHAAGASTVRVRLAATGPGSVRVDVADTGGKPVATVESLLLRAVSAEAARGAHRDSLFRWDWTPLTSLPEDRPEPDRLVLAGANEFGLAGAVHELSRVVEVYLDLALVAQESGPDSPAPELVLVPLVPVHADGVVPAAHDLTEWVLGQLQDHL
ncbi:hypothetical protein, partial [Amycolatopsis sp. SID8362]|uniref:hypothetical protein n=1 Tax=Amycolatopsis sp. SID8362 TaxID=2690346 RepID=UPI00136BD936